MTWIQQGENRLFRILNQRIQHAVLDSFFNNITHLGGAIWTITLTVLAALLLPQDWKAPAFQSMIALAVSHVPVAVIKRKWPRLRPYLVIPEANNCRKPLTDHSFPSGHTTAIFSITTPFILFSPVLALCLLPAAVLVGLSRIYLGQHYPSDCIAGALIGSASAYIIVAIYS